MIAKLILQTLLYIAGMGALLFIAAGTWHWPAAWLFLAAMAVLGLGSGVWLAKTDPALLAERMRPMMQDGQPAADKKFMLVFGAAAALAWFVATAWCRESGSRIERVFDPRFSITRQLPGGRRCPSPKPIPAAAIAAWCGSNAPAILRW
jgi:hypothetical protein